MVLLHLKTFDPFDLFRLYCNTARNPFFTLTSKEDWYIHEGPDHVKMKESWRGKEEVKHMVELEPTAC